MFLLFTILFNVFITLVHSQEGCDQFQKDSRCVVTTDNLIADVDGEVIQGEVQCQVLCNSLAGSWFNFKKGDGCQILRFCNEFQSEPGVTTGPNMPPIDSCQKPSPIPKGSVLVIGGEYTDTLPTVEVITDDLQVLTRLVPDAPDRNVYWTGQKVGDEVIICGGQETYVADGEIACYHLDVNLNQWTRQTSLNRARVRPQSTLTPDGLMTIFGGDWYLKDVEIFDGKTWKQQPVWTMPDSNYNFCMVTHGTDIYIIGGSYESSVVRLDTLTELYHDMPSLSENYNYHRCLLTSISGSLGIMVTGSLYSDNSKWSEFLSLSDPKGWIRLADMNVGRFNHGFAILNGRPTVFGGENGKTAYLNDFEYYSEDENVWIPIANVTLPKPKTKFAYVKI